MVGRYGGTASGKAPKPGLAVLVLLGLLVSVLPQVDSVAAAGNPTHAWKAVETPNVGFATNRLAAIDCISETECWAVGNGWPELIGYPVFAHWTGGDWSTVEVPTAPDTMTYLNDISCVSTGQCFAVGAFGNPIVALTGGSLFMQGIIFQWDGDAWSSQEFPFQYVNGQGTTQESFSTLRGVDCIAADDCWAVGVAYQGGPHNVFLHWNGDEWTEAATSSALDTEELALGSISCSSTQFCMAIGPFRDNYINPGPQAAVAAQWNGNAWTMAPSPAAHSIVGEGSEAYQYKLNGLHCAAANDCWAVGDAELDDSAVTGVVTSLPLVEHWDGVAWTSTILPQAPLAVPAAPGGIDSHLNDVTCTSSSDCWAVGHSDNKGTVPGAVSQEFVLHWDGTAWLPGPTLPDPTATFDGNLAGIACPSASLCWAVGQIQPASQWHGLIKKWDGSKWSSVASPFPETLGGNVLHEVACPAPDDCWAVGTSDFGQLRRTLIQHWNGVTWTVVPSPNSALDRSNSLVDISCASTSDCWAVGSTGTEYWYYEQPLAMHWDGATWTLSNPIVVPLDKVSQAYGENAYPNSINTDTVLQAVDCLAPDDCWAVGSITTMPVTQASIVPYHAKPLFLHWDGQSWQPAPHAIEEAAPMTDSILNDVTCVSSTDCTAVGEKFARFEYHFNELLLAEKGRDAQTLVNHWDGVTWTSVPSPNLTPNVNKLLTVSCTPTTCWAFGIADIDDSYNDNDEGRSMPIALQRGADGIWTPAGLPEGTDKLASVTCIAADDCWAIGSPQGTGATKTTSLHWDGAAWTAAHTPKKLKEGASTPNVLRGLACTSTSDCWAVGNFQTGKPAHMETFAVHYTACPNCRLDELTITSPAEGALVPTGALTVAGSVTRGNMGTSAAFDEHGFGESNMASQSSPAGNSLPNEDESSDDEDVFETILRVLGLREAPTFLDFLGGPSEAEAPETQEPASTGPIGIIPGSALVPGVIMDIGPVSVGEDAGNLVVKLSINGFADAPPGANGEPISYAVDLTASNNPQVLTYHLELASTFDPMWPLNPQYSFTFAVNSENVDGLVSHCPMDADISASYYDPYDTKQVVWIVSLAEFDATNLLPQGPCGNPGQGRGLQAGDVLTDIIGIAMPGVGGNPLVDFDTTTNPITYTVTTGDGGDDEGGDDEGDEGEPEHVVLLLGDVEIGSQQVSTSESSPTATWSIDIDLSSWHGQTIALQALWLDAAGRQVAFDTVQVTVETLQEANLAPVLADIGSKQVAEGSPLYFAIFATDGDGDTLTYSATGLPSGASLTPAGAFAWTPTRLQAGTYPVTFVASDGALQDSEVVTITVSNTNWAPILADVGEDVLVAPGDEVYVPLSASDQDTDDTLAYSVSGLPASAVLSGTSLIWIPDADEQGTFVATFKVEDGQGGSDTETIVVRVTAFHNDATYANVASLAPRGDWTPSASDNDALFADAISSTASVWSEDDGPALFSWVPGVGRIAFEQVADATAEHGIVVVTPKSPQQIAKVELTSLKCIEARATVFLVMQPTAQRVAGADQVVALDVPRNLCEDDAIKETWTGNVPAAYSGWTTFDYVIGIQPMAQTGGWFEYGQLTGR